MQRRYMRGTRIRADSQQPSATCQQQHLSFNGQNSKAMARFPVLCKEGLHAYLCDNQWLASGQWHSNWSGLGVVCCFLQAVDIRISPSSLDCNRPGINGGTQCSRVQ